MWAGVAQLVEHLICNQRVGGSIPSASSTTSSVGSEAKQFQMLKLNGLVSLDTSPFCVFVDWPRKCRSKTILGHEFASRRVSGFRVFFATPGVHKLYLQTLEDQDWDGWVSG